MAPRFSIIVPTRERLRTLGPCLRSCLYQTHTTFEVVVQDNASADGTGEFVQSLDDPRIKYFRNASRTSMRQNFENAFANATGEYLISIGDDDGMVPGALETLDRALGFGRYDFATWPPVYYFWPGYNDQPGVPLKRHSLFGAVETIGANSALDKLRNARPVHFRHMPKLYHGCVSRGLVDRVRAQTGTVFLYDIPDIYAQAALSFAAGEGIALGHPVSIQGGSTNSTGSSQFESPAGSPSSIGEAPFDRFVKEASTDQTAPIPYNSNFASMSYYLYVSLVIAQKAFQREDAIDNDGWIKRIVQELSRDAHTLGGAKRAPSLSLIDEKILFVLRTVPDPSPKIASDSIRKSGKSRRRYLSRCMLLTELNGENTIDTASRVLGTAFAKRAVNYTWFPGWQLLQAQSWLQMVIANRGRALPR